MTDAQVLRMALQSITSAQMSAQAFLVAMEMAANTLQHAINTLDPPVRDPNAPCPHPHDKLEDRRTMGNANRWFCHQCKQEVTLD